MHQPCSLEDDVTAVPAQLSRTAVVTHAGVCCRSGDSADKTGGHGQAAQSIAEHILSQGPACADARAKVGTTWKPACHTLQIQLKPKALNRDRVKLTQQHDTRFVLQVSPHNRLRVNHGHASSSVESQKYNAMLYDSMLQYTMQQYRRHHAFLHLTSQPQNIQTALQHGGRP